MDRERAMQGGWKRFVPGATPAHEPEPAPAELAPRAEEPEPEASRPAGTFISSGAIFEGRLSLRGDFHIDTEYRGSLVTDGTISVGPNGSVEGDIRAREIVIRGAVVGNVKASSQLVLEASGRLHGDIETACLEIRKHAFFKGSTTMTMPQMGRAVASPRQARAGEGASFASVSTGAP